MKLDIEMIKNHWVESSDEDFQTMLQLINSQSYNWALFIGHISIEKLLKGLYVAVHEKHAPPIHNLYRLAELCKLEVTEEQATWLDTITSFNIRARYDDHKKEFNNLCTPDYSKIWMNRITELREWIKKKF